MKNYICFGGRFRVRYAYVDTHNYIADSLFYKREIPVKFMDEYVKDGEDYRIIFCSIKRRYNEQFKKALEELKSKMLLCGHNDYEEYCNKLMEQMHEK